MIKKFVSYLFCLGLIATTSCQPIIFAQSDSPDGRYRCEVIRVRPEFSALFGDGEDWRYDFSIRNVTTGQSSPGGSFEYGDGKIKLDENKLEFKWTSNQLAVVDRGSDPAREFLIASFDSTSQHWKQTN